MGGDVQANTLEAPYEMSGVIKLGLPVEDMPLLATCDFNHFPALQYFSQEDILPQQPSKEYTGTYFVICLANNEITYLRPPNSAKELLPIIKNSRYISDEKKDVIINLLNVAISQGRSEAINCANIREIINAIVGVEAWEYTSVVDELFKQFDGRYNIPDYNAIFNITQIEAEGNTYSHNELKLLQERLLHQWNNLRTGQFFVFDISKLIELDHYLYRAVRSDEWQQLCRDNGDYIIRNDTNFVTEEDYKANSGSFTSIFKNDPEYAGRLVRVRSDLQAYSKKFTGGKLIAVAVCSHMVRNCEYFDDDTNEWSSDWAKFKNS